MASNFLFLSIQDTSTTWISSILKVVCVWLEINTPPGSSIVEEISLKTSLEASDTKDGYTTDSDINSWEDGSASDGRSNEEDPFFTAPSTFTLKNYSVAFLFKRHLCDLEIYKGVMDGYSGYNQMQ